MRPLEIKHNRHRRYMSPLTWLKIQGISWIVVSTMDIRDKWSLQNRILRCTQALNGAPEKKNPEKLKQMNLGGTSSIPHPKSACFKIPHAIVCWMNIKTLKVGWINIILYIYSRFLQYWSYFWNFLPHTWDNFQMHSKNIGFWQIIIDIILLYIVLF